MAPERVGFFVARKGVSHLPATLRWDAADFIEKRVMEGVKR
jgi:hypothetical protein